MNYILLIILLVFSLCKSTVSQKKVYPKDIETGSQRTDLYYPLINDKKVAVVANHTSLTGQEHLVDKLMDDKIHIMKVFSPEHGFRGNADAGEKVDDNIDTKTGLPIISLYGNHRKPTPSDLDSVDIVLFDIQDVGARVYTYISTMTYVMEACADAGIPVIILDRPNPHGHYVDGPVLEKELSSFVGMHEIPLVHGMTIGEYAKMINEENWLNSNTKCDLSIIPIKNYNHKMLYQLPVKPSPNLPNMNAIYLYPSLVLFEGTIISVGRGTDNPFEIIGHPDYMIGSCAFTPKSGPGSKNPKHKGEFCTGIGLINYSNYKVPDQVELHWLLNMYDYFLKQWERNGQDYTFFTGFFKKLAGTIELQQQIISGKTEEEIRESWQDDIDHFKKTRKKYLLYPDFE